VREFHFPIDDKNPFAALSTSIIIAVIVVENFLHFFSSSLGMLLERVLIWRVGDVVATYSNRRGGLYTVIELYSCVGMRLLTIFLPRYK